MIWIRTIRSASTKLRLSPFTESMVEGVHSLVYRPGIEPLAHAGLNSSTAPRGTFARGLHRISGMIFAHDGSAAETLLGTTDEIDLIVRYRANGGTRKRTLSDVIFVGDSAVAIPSLNRGRPELVGVPFRVQIPEGSTLANHVIDAVDA
jgi:hypothetical protein